MLRSKIDEVFILVIILPLGELTELQLHNYARSMTGGSFMRGQIQWEKYASKVAIQYLTHFHILDAADDIQGVKVQGGLLSTKTFV